MAELAETLSLYFTLIYRDYHAVNACTPSESWLKYKLNMDLHYTIEWPADKFGLYFNLDLVSLLRELTKTKLRFNSQTCLTNLQLHTKKVVTCSGLPSLRC